MLSQSTLRHAVERGKAGAGSVDGSLKKLPLDRIQPGPFQPRSMFDPQSMEELAQSIRAQGVIQPIMVRPLGDDYEIIAGERGFTPQPTVALPCESKSTSRVR